MLDGRIDEIIVFFPLMELKQVHQLRYGHVGAANEFISKYPALMSITPALCRTIVDGDPIEEPVVAVASSNHSKFIGELECLSFLAVCEPRTVAEDEILSQKTIFTVRREGNDHVLCVDGFAWLPQIQDIQSVRFRDFPKAFVRWDRDAISGFEAFLSRALGTDLYQALVECLADANDKEVRKERSRIIISITLFNQAFIHLPVNSSFSNLQLVLICAAFEALLNLPNGSISSSFGNAVMTLMGVRTALLKRWCREFYDRRSGLVHGDVAWEKEESVFDVGGGEPLYHTAIANRLFTHCLKTKLFLSGLLASYDREELMSELIKSGMAALFIS